MAGKWVTGYGPGESPSADRDAEDGIAKESCKTAPKRTTFV